MTRTVADNRLLYEVMQGPDPRDVHAIRPFAADQRPPDGRLEGVRIGWMAQVGNRVDPEVLAQAEAIVRLLESMGAAVEPVELDFASLEREFLIILQSGLSARLRRYLPEYAERIDASLRTTIERGSAWSAEELQQAGMARTELFRRLQRDFERYEFLLSPTLSAPALPVTQDAFAPVIVDGEPAGQLRGAWYPYTWPFNLTGHPALTIPSGWTATKLPTAVQIVGPFYAEARLFTWPRGLNLPDPGRTSVRQSLPDPPGSPPAAPWRSEADHDAGGRGSTGTEAEPRGDAGQGARPCAPMAAEDRERPREVDHRPRRAGGSDHGLRLPPAPVDLPRAGHRGGHPRRAAAEGAEANGDAGERATSVGGAATGLAEVAC
jgi:hypothetical protein